MRLVLSVLVVLSLCLAVVQGYGKKGVLELDEVTFDKIIDGSKTALVMAVEYSWKQSEQYEPLGEEFAARKDIIIAKFSYKDNQKLKDRFNVQKEPTLLFFPQGSTTPVIYEGNGESTTTADIQTFMNNQLNPNMVELSKLAGKYAAASSSERASLAKEAEAMLAKLDQQLFGEYVKVYQRCLEKINSENPEYAIQEYGRLYALIQNKSTLKPKRDEFSKRLSVVGLFVPQDKQQAEKERAEKKVKEEALKKEQEKKKRFEEEKKKFEQHKPTHRPPVPPKEP